MIKLKCERCKHQIEITDEELKENGMLYTHCLHCGGKMDVLNLDEIAKKDIYTQAENYIKKWVSEIGWDNTLDLIQRNKDQGCYKIYKEILTKMGFKLK